VCFILNVILISEKLPTLSVTREEVSAKCIGVVLLGFFLRKVVFRDYSVRYLSVKACYTMTANLTNRLNEKPRAKSRYL